MNHEFQDDLRKCCAGGNISKLPLLIIYLLYLEFGTSKSSSSSEGMGAIMAEAVEGK